MYPVKGCERTAAKAACKKDGNVTLKGHPLCWHTICADWPTTPEGEERQKEKMEQKYRFLFHHPQVEAITGWNFADGAWLSCLFSRK